MYRLCVRLEFDVDGWHAVDLSQLPFEDAAKFPQQVKQPSALFLRDMFWHLIFEAGTVEDMIWSYIENLHDTLFGFGHTS